MKRRGKTNGELRKLGVKVANPERVQADQEQRRSSAARPHDPRPHRQRSRLESLRAAIRDADW